MPAAPMVRSPSSLWLPPGSSLRVHKGGVVKLLLTCLGSAPCTGTAKMTFPVEWRVTIAADRFKLAANTRRSVVLKLNRKGRGILEDKKKIRAHLRLNGAANEPFSVRRSLRLWGLGL